MINLHLLNLQIYKIECCILSINKILNKIQYYTHYSNKDMGNKYVYLYNLRWKLYLELIALNSSRSAYLILNNLPRYQTQVVL